GRSDSNQLVVISGRVFPRFAALHLQFTSAHSRIRPLRYHRQTYEVRRAPSRYPLDENLGTLKPLQSFTDRDGTRVEGISMLWAIALEIMFIIALETIRVFQIAGQVE